MRITENEIKIIKSVVKSFFSNCKIYLHGSRLNDSRKGGDIDLFVVVRDIDYSQVSDLRYQINSQLSLRLMEQKVDVVYLSESQESSHSFFKNSQKLML